MLNALAIGTIALASATALPRPTGPDAPGAAPGDEGRSILIMKDGRIFTEFGLEQKTDHVEVTLEAGKVEVDNALVEIVLKEGQEVAFTPQTDEEREKYEKGFVPFNGRWIKKKNAERAIKKDLEDRLEQAEEDLAHQEWRNKYETETKHFRWFHTTPQRVTRRFMDSSDAYYDIFKKDWGIKRNKRKPKLSINFYNDASEYQQIAGAPPGALAYFMFLGDYDLNAFYDRLDPDFTEQVVFHELGHYLHKLIDEQFNYPHWPGESLCEYYGGARLDEATGKLEVGLIHNGRLATIKGQMAEGEKIELEKMITTRGFEDYTWGWSFVHMLMQDKSRRKNFRKFFLGLASDKKVKRERGGFNLKTVTGQEVLRYFMECMKIPDRDALRELEKEWYEYIDEELDFDGENALIWEAKTAKNLGERDKARDLYKKALSENFEGAPASAHYEYWRLMEKKDGSDGIKQLRAAVRKAPLTALFRWELGELLEDRKKDKEEGALNKAIAKELDPYIDRNALRFRFD